MEAHAFTAVFSAHRHRRRVLRALLAALLAVSCTAGAQTGERFVTIGGGDVSGVYYPAGLAISRLMNRKRDEHGIRTTVEATSGSTFNLDAILAGYLEFGLAQSDKQYEAVNGLAEWGKTGPQGELRSVFSIHHETVTLVAAASGDIRDITDLRGKRVSTGNPGSSEHRIVMDALTASGLDPRGDLDLLRVRASEAAAYLHDDRIDAFFFTVGHPSDTIRNALVGRPGARIVPVTGPGIDRLVTGFSPYVASSIPVSQLYPELTGHDDVPSFGVKAILCTSSRVPDEIVYALTREVFENLDAFREQHPAFDGLTRRGMLEGLSAPVHAGALRYFREAGLLR